MSFKQDVFEPKVSFDILEEAGQVDGKYILARVAGQFFVPNGKSRNERFYPRALWEKALADKNVQSRLAERRMFGTGGHNLEIDDEALREGQITHIVTKLEIRGESGYGEALVLDTPAGRVLNTMLRAGCKLFVSSRANGDYAGETEEGLPIVNPETYQLQTFDFVIEPGFLEANPSLVENRNQSPRSSSEGVPVMDKIIEQLSKENGALKADLERSLKENEGMKSQTSSLIEENKHLSAKADKVESLVRQLEKFKALGSVEEIGRMMERAEKVISEYKKLGSSKEISRALDLAHATISNYKKFGEAKEIRLALERASKALEAYKAYGSIPEMKALISRVEKDQKMVGEAKRKTRIEALAKDLGVSEEAIKAVYGKLAEGEIRKLFSNVIKENSTSDKWRKNDSAPSKKKDEKKSSPMDKSTGRRLMESLCR